MQITFLTEEKALKLLDKCIQSQICKFWWSKDRVKLRPLMQTIWVRDIIEEISSEMEKVFK